MSAACGRRVSVFKSCAGQKRAARNSQMCNRSMPRCGCRRRERMKALARYLANLTTGRVILWCYLIWYLVVLVHYFDPSLRIWLTSVGLAAIVGTALYISSTAQGNKLGGWQIARLYMM